MEVKSIILRVDQENFEKLKKLKGSKTWEDFLLSPHLVQNPPRVNKK